MISKPDHTKQVTFTGERVGGRVTVRSLVSALESALVWLRGHDPDDTVDWEVVRVAIGKSLRFTFSSPVSNGDISDRMHNLHNLQKKKMPKVPPRLTDEDVEGTKKLAAMIGDEFKSIRISSPGEPTVKLTPVLVQRVGDIASAERGPYQEWNTIRGVLDQITASQFSCRFRLKHQLTGEYLGCTVPPERLDEIKDALPHRVEVYGRVKYDRTHRPKSIDAEKIRRLPESDTPFDSLPPINITSGLSSEEYVERLRVAE